MSIDIYYWISFSTTYCLGKLTALLIKEYRNTKIPTINYIKPKILDMNFRPWEYKDEMLNYPFPELKIIEEIKH